MGPDDEPTRELVQGARPFLQKPFTAEELIARVDDLLRRVP
jgi:DNA-binding response OmpR family regulator